MGPPQEYPQGRGDIHREQTSLLKGRGYLLLRDGRSPLGLLSSPASVVAVATHQCKLVAELGSPVVPTHDAHKTRKAIIASIYDGQRLQNENEVQGGMVLVCQALGTLVPEIMDQQPSGCDNPLGWRRIVAHCYTVTLLIVPFVRRGTITTRGGQASRPPLVRATTSPIPRGHGLVRGIVRPGRADGGGHDSSDTVTAILVLTSNGERER